MNWMGGTSTRLPPPPRPVIAALGITNAALCESVSPVPRPEAFLVCQGRGSLCFGRFVDCLRTRR
jgi:hypothetical protein